MADGAEAGVEPSFVLAQMRVFLATQGDDSGHSRGPDDAERIDAGERIYELSADADSAEFMHRHHLLALLQHTGRTLLAREPPCPRLMELCIGSLANLCAVNDSARRAPPCREFLAHVLVSTTDAPTLLELLRLLLTLFHHAAACAEGEGGGRVATMVAWLDALATPACLNALTFFLANTLRTDVLSSTADVFRSLLYMGMEACAGGGNHGDENRVLCQLRSEGHLSQICSVVDAQCSNGAASKSSGGDVDDALRAVLKLVDALVSAGTIELKHVRGPVANVARLHCDLETRACAVAALAAMAAMHGADSGGGAAAAALAAAAGDDDDAVVAALILLRDMESEYSYVHGDSSAAQISQYAMDGVHGAWSILHTSAAALDGFGLCLQGSSDGESAQSHTFVLFLSHARLLRRAVEWIVRAEPSSSTGSPQESGTAELAAATVSSILEVADVVVTADSCHTAVGGLHLQETVDGARGSRVGAGTPPSNPSEFVLEAVNCLRPCLRDASVSSADEPEEAAAAGLTRRRSRSRSGSWSRSPQRLHKRTREGDIMCGFDDDFRRGRGAEWADDSD